jgi:hypothetical protein
MLPGTGAIRMTWMHADGYGERPMRTAAPFRFVTTGSSVGRSVRLFVEMKRHCECCRGSGDAKKMGELI